MFSELMEYKHKNKNQLDEPRIIIYVKKKKEEGVISWYNLEWKDPEILIQGCLRAVSNIRLKILTTPKLTVGNYSASKITH